MTATKKLTSFSVCLQCVFACTIGSGKLLKCLPPYFLGVKRQSRAAWSRRVGKGELL